MHYEKAGVNGVNTARASPMPRRDAHSPHFRYAFPPVMRN